jgi:maleylpyruvate isomerase
MTTPELTEPDDPAAAAAELSARLEAATLRLQHTAVGITDEQAREPSLLPGWSRGHLLTHLARNADSLRNLLIWARTGIVTPQYASAGERDEQIEAGADRPAATLLADVIDSASELDIEAGRLADGDWAAEVKGGVNGPPHPAWYTLWRRLSEVEIHHVDLGAGYRPADWPADFAAQRLATAAGDFAAKAGCPRVTLRATESGTEHEIGPGDGAATLTVSGPTRQLLAWLIGRSVGADLTADPAGPLPALPAW